MSPVPNDWVKLVEGTSVTRGEVHVWRFNLASGPDVEQVFRQVLDEPETVRADRFIRPEHRTRFAVGRGVLRYLLGRYTDTPPSEIHFDYNAHGKPSLADADAGIEFNVSNTGSLGVIAITAGQPIGIDIERYRKKLEMEKVARRFFAPAEVDFLFELEPELRTRAFYRCWSSKEAIMKACGRGLSLGLSRFEVNVDPDASPRLLTAPPELGDIEHWQMESIPMEPEVEGIIALEGTVDSAKLFQIDPASLL